MHKDAVEVAGRYQAAHLRDLVQGQIAVDQKFRRLADADQFQAVEDRHAGVFPEGVAEVGLRDVDSFRNLVQREVFVVVLRQEIDDPAGQFGVAGRVDDPGAAGLPVLRGQMIDQRFKGDGGRIVLHGPVQPVFARHVRDQLGREAVVDDAFGRIRQDPVQRFVQHHELDLIGQNVFGALIDEAVLNALVDQDGVVFPERQRLFFQGKGHLAAFYADQMVIVVVGVDFDAVAGLQRAVRYPEELQVFHGRPFPFRVIGKV